MAGFRSFGQAAERSAVGRSCPVVSGGFRLHADIVGLFVSDELPCCASADPSCSHYFWSVGLNVIQSLSGGYLSLNGHW
jgi:hypothetical protein